MALLRRIQHLWSGSLLSAQENEGLTLLKIGEYLRAHYGITSLGIIGFCWGGVDLALWHF